MFLIMDNDVIPSPLSALMATYRADDFLLVGGVIVIVSVIYNKPILENRIFPWYSVKGIAK
jgi:hypothetical protein